ncbi:MAG: hypothetical protein AAGE84_23685 [Cyanobacteria bacterium P01_G01_bin.39]
MNPTSSNFKKYYSPLIGAALATASLFQFALPVLSIGTSAGTGLVNSATATYDDQDNNSYEVTSNEVTVTVGKIAGITNVPIDFQDNTVNATNTTILPGDEVQFDFEITNTGNDASDIFIPDTGDVTVENLVVDQVQYIAIDSGGNEVVINRGDTGTVDGNPVTFTDGIIQDVDENDSIIIRVIATVSSTATEGDNISVQLGDTGTNTADVNSADYPGTQNQPDLGATNDVQATDVRTQTADGANVAVPGDPVNGQREASAKEIRTIGSESLALARLEKTNAGVDAGADPNVLTDNIITYNLNLEVAGINDPQVAAYSNFPFNAEDLEGRDYTGQFDFTGAAAPPADETNLILVSDAIPENTELDPTSVAPPNANWTVVYTTDALTVPADDADWVATAPAADTITRVGWVYDAEVNGALLAGSNTQDFEFQVVTVGLTSNTATAIYNMGQVFGTTDDNNPGVTGLISYDESGDQNPANLNDDGTFGPDETATDNDGNGTFGVADPDTVGGDGDPEDNVDLNGDNTGSGSEAGEVNKVVVTPEAVVSDIFNGPENNADAVGGIFDALPADDNHDFQNLAAAIPDSSTQTTGGTDGAADTTYDPDAVTFTNSVSNPSQAGINNIILEPISPEDLSLGGDNGDLPTGTRVVILYDEDQDGTTDQIAAYDYDATTGTYTIDAGVGTGTPVVIPNIPLLSEVTYDVRINLPAGTELSTSFEGGDPANDLVGGFPAVIAAYIDDGANAGLEADDTYNVTVNQVYTGYLQLLKKARVLRDDGNGVFAEVAGMGFNDPDGDKEAAPGDLLEYQITYTNISDDGGSGTGNGLLQADDVVITEDGTAGNNNWAVDNDDPNEDGDNLIDTLLPLSGANDTTTGSVITYFDENNVGSTDPGAFSTELANFEVTDDIVKYEVSGITRLEPGESGVFTFQRKITSPADIEDLEP